MSKRTKAGCHDFVLREIPEGVQENAMAVAKAQGYTLKTWLVTQIRSGKPKLAPEEGDTFAKGQAYLFRDIPNALYDSAKAQAAAAGLSVRCWLIAMMRGPGYE